MAKQKVDDPAQEFQAEFTAIEEGLQELLADKAKREEDLAAAVQAVTRARAARDACFNAGDTAGFTRAMDGLRDANTRLEELKAPRDEAEQQACLDALERRQETLFRAAGARCQELRTRLDAIRGELQMAENWQHQASGLLGMVNRTRDALSLPIQPSQIENAGPQIS